MISWSNKVICIFGATLALSACVTARMHDEFELNRIARACGLALGELFQDESEKRLLFAVRYDPTVEQRACVGRWARKNGMKAVFVRMEEQN